jgi:hypothetical protein
MDQYKFPSFSSSSDTSVNREAWDDLQLTEQERAEVVMPMLVPSVFGKAMMQLARMLPEMMRQLDASNAENKAYQLGIQHFTKKEVAEIFNISVRQIEKWVANGKFTPVDYFPGSKSKDYRFTYAEIKRFSDQHRMEQPKKERMDAMLIKGRNVKRRA